jgi:hypothetical protein
LTVAKSRLAQPNRTLAAGVTVTATSEAAGRPASYLLSPWRTKKWRSATNTSDQRVTFDLGSAQSFRALFVTDARIHAGGSLRAQANSSDAWGAPPVNELLPAPSARSRLTGVWLSATQTYRYVSLFFDNPGVSDYVEASLYVVAPYLEPPVNVRDDLQFRFVDPSRVTSSPDGQRQALTQTKYAMFRGIYADILLADADALVAVHTALGVGQPFIFSIDPADLEQTILGYLAADIEKTHVAQSTGRYDVQLSVEEAR